MIRNTANQSIGAQMVSATDGSAFTGTVTVYITGDAGTQAIGTVGSGLCTHEGNGYHTYRPSADETAFSLVAFTFIGTGAIPRTIQVVTVTDEQSQALVSSASTSSTVNVTALSIITMALKLLGVLAAGETASSDEVADAFALLNSLVDSLGTQRLSPYTSARSTYTWTASDSSATIGASGADFTQQRPVSVSAAGFIPDGLTTEFSLNVFGQTEYARVVDKTLTSTQPDTLYVEPTHPLLILRLYPIPTVAGTLCLYYPTALTQFANLTTSYTFPNGYARLFYGNLAKELIPFYPEAKPARIASVLEMATTSLADVKRQNTEIPVIGGEVVLPYNIYVDSN